jgi:L-rhamnose mutarotase
VKHFGLTLNLHDDADKIAAYRRFHQAVWPEVTDRLRACGVEQMQIFLRGARLFMYLVTDDAFDPARDFARINEDPTSARWNALMADLQARAPEANPDEWWAAMDLVFDLNWPQHQSR